MKIKGLSLILCMVFLFTTFLSCIVPEQADAVTPQLRRTISNENPLYMVSYISRLVQIEVQMTGKLFLHSQIRSME